MDEVGEDAVELGVLAQLAWKCKERRARDAVVRLREEAAARAYQERLAENAQRQQLAESDQKVVANDRWNYPPELMQK